MWKPLSLNMLDNDKIIYLLCFSLMEECCGLYDLMVPGMLLRCSVVLYSMQYSRSSSLTGLLFCETIIADNTDNIASKDLPV